MEDKPWWQNRIFSNKLNPFHMEKKKWVVSSKLFVFYAATSLTPEILPGAH